MDINITLKDGLLEKPKESGYYLCRVDGEWVILHYSKTNGLFNAYDNWDFSYAVKCSTRVEFWAALPEV